MRKFNNRGVTLVELMIVVAIIAILAGLSMVAYGNYIKSGKIQRLTAIAQDIAQGQERYRSRYNTYYPAAGGTSTYAADTTAFQNLLDFSTPVPPGVEVETESWDAAATCTICRDMGPVAGQSGFAVVVTQDLNESSPEETTVVFHNLLPAPIVLFEGE